MSKKRIKGVKNLTDEGEKPFQFEVLIIYKCRRKFKRQILELYSGIWKCDKRDYERIKTFAKNEMHKFMEEYGKTELYSPKEIKPVKIRVTEMKSDEPLPTKFEILFRIFDLKLRRENHKKVKMYMRQKL